MIETKTNLLTYLRELAVRVCGPYQVRPATRAILSIGSVSYGVVDEYSDVDIALYYSDLHSEDELRTAMRRNGCNVLDWVLGDRSQGGLIESHKSTEWTANSPTQRQRIGSGV